jgi:hypothetical protein
MWPFAIHQAAIIHNALATASTSAVHVLAASTTIGPARQPAPAGPLSPYSMLTGKRFNARWLQPLFCKCEVIIRNTSDLAALTKAEPRTTDAIHLGLDHRRAGFFVYLIRYARFTTSHYFDTFFPDSVTYPPLSSIIGHITQKDSSHRLPTEQQQIETRPEPEPAMQPQLTRDDDDDHNRNTHLPSGHTRAARARRDAAPLAALAVSPVDGYIDLGATIVEGAPCHLLLKADVWRPMPTPANTPEALAQDYDGWMHAYKKDFEAKMANGAFEYIKRPANKVVHKIGWAHKIVWNDDNTVSELRARLVGRPFNQIQGRDYVSSYSATPRISAVRAFIATMEALDLDDEHNDVIKAFTQNKLNDVDEFFVEQPPALPKVKGPDGRDLVMRAIMALEGFMQSGHLHQRNHSATFTTKNSVAVFEQLDAEPTIFVYRRDDMHIAALVWTDDVLFAFNRKGKPTYESFLKEVYGKRWNFKRKGPVTKFAGLTIRRNRCARSIAISLADFIEGMYNRFVPAGHPIRSQPAASKDQYDKIALAKDAAERSQMQSKPFLAGCACMIWVASTVRGDLSIYVVKLCKVMHDPGLHAWNVLVDLIAYCYYSRAAQLTYYGHPSKWAAPAEFLAAKGDHSKFVSNWGLHSYVDSSWNTESYGGYVTIIFGSPMDWGTKLIKVICHSSAEAEIGGGCIMAKAYMYTRQLFAKLGVSIDGPTPAFIDSEAGIAIANNVGVTKRTMHFLRWQHYLRWIVQHFYIGLFHIGTKRQLADGLTKVVDITLYRALYKLFFRSS